MTIDSSWIQALKEDIPCAFTPHKPFSPRAVFIDGQIKLNAPQIEHTQTWDEYIKRQFLYSIQRYLKQPKVEAVIIAFDNYSLVPNAKGMTQSKRRRYVPQIDFDARNALPPTVPKGQDWVAHLMNRTFKTKLIEMIVYFLVTHLEIGEDQSLIVDYQGNPKRYNCRKEVEEIDEMEALGEADVKFPRYAGVFGMLQVDSIDGDSVPIAMLYLQNSLKRGSSPRISILRMVTRVAETSEEEPRAKKQRLPPPPTATPAPAPAPKKPASKREYEYVDMNRLYWFVTETLFPQCLDRAVMPRIKGNEVNLLIGLIGLSGTDFTRKMGGVTGKTLYEYLPCLCGRLGLAFNEETNHFIVENMLHQVVGRVYVEKFHRYLKGGPTKKLEELLGILQRSKLGDRMKNCIQSFETLECTVKNVNWLMQYWTHGTYPSPVQEQYGFVLKSNGAVDYVH